MSPSRNPSPLPFPLTFVTSPLPSRLILQGCIYNINDSIYLNFELKIIREILRISSTSNIEKWLFMIRRYITFCTVQQPPPLTLTCYFLSRLQKSSILPYHTMLPPPRFLTVQIPEIKYITPPPYFSVKFCSHFLCLFVIPSFPVLSW